MNGAMESSFQKMNSSIPIEQLGGNGMLIMLGLLFQLNDAAVVDPRRTRPSDYCVLLPRSLLPWLLGVYKIWLYAQEIGNSVH